MYPATTTSCPSVTRIRRNASPNRVCWRCASPGRHLGTSRPPSHMAPNRLSFALLTLPTPIYILALVGAGAITALGGFAWVWPVFLGWELALMVELSWLGALPDRSRVQYSVAFVLSVSVWLLYLGMSGWGIEFVLDYVGFDASGAPRDGSAERMMHVEVAKSLLFVVHIALDVVRYRALFQTVDRAFGGAVKRFGLVRFICSQVFIVWQLLTYPRMREGLHRAYGLASTDSRDASQGPFPEDRRAVPQFGSM